LLSTPKPRRDHSGERGRRAAEQLDKRAAIRSRCKMVVDSGGKTSPLSGARANDSIDRSMSAALATGLRTSSIASDGAAVGAPKETPAEVIEKLNKEINAVVADPLIKARLASLGVDPMSMQERGR
jgi:hypothetical protein